MLRPRLCRLSGALFMLLAAYAVATGPASAGTAVTLDASSGTSPIVVRGDAAPVSGGSAPGSAAAGVAFENDADSAATSVDFTWVFVDGNGSIVAEERTTERGRFQPARSASARVRFAGYTTGSVAFVADPQTNAYVPVQRIGVVVDDATFADGSSWQGRARETFAPPPEGFADATVAAVKLRVLRIASTRAAGPYDRVDTRLSFANDSAKRIDAIEFAYTFYDLYGDALMENTAVVRGVYPRGAISTLNPMTRVEYPGVVLSRGSIWLGWGAEAEYVARIGIAVKAVRYSDGTTWFAPG